MRRTTGGAAVTNDRSDRRSGVLVAVVLVVLAIGLWVRAGAGMPMSAVDEHMHLDTHVRVHDGGYPHRGSLMTMDVVREWACGVGHEAGAAMAPCDHPDLGPNSLPSGIYTTGYIHYPTYFVLAEVYRGVEETVVAPDSWVDTYRRFAALLTIAGLVACLAGAWSLGLRRGALVAGALGPSAAAGILLFGTVANPQSAAILLGALIAWSGLRWVRNGSGFWWLAASTTLASCVAVTHSLPAGAFIVAILAALVLRRAGWQVAGRWEPRWWHAGVLSIIVVAPVIVFGGWISSHATISDGELYSFAALDSWHAVAAGALEELSTLHSPWYVTGSLGVGGSESLPQLLLRSSVQGLPLWQTLGVFAAVVAVSVRLASGMRTAGRAEDGTVSPTDLLTACTLIGLLVYPALLRVSNAVNVGFDYPVVSRYSIGFAPLLMWLVLLEWRGHTWLMRGLATLATVTPLAIGLALW